PGPSSSTLTTHPSPFRDSELVTLPRDTTASSAFTTMFEKISFNASALTPTEIGVDGTSIRTPTPRRSASGRRTPITSRTTLATSDVAPTSLPRYESSLPPLFRRKASHHEDARAGGH